MSAMHFTKENFEQEVLNSTVPVLVDFWAPWCGPCRMVGPIIEEIANEVEAQAKVGKINVDEEPLLASNYGVVSIPTIIVFKDGKVLNKAIGMKSKNDLKKMLL